MGSTVSRNTDSNHSGSYREDGAQLYVSLKMENFKIKIKGDLVPHVYGSERIIGSWDPSKAVCNQVFFSKLDPIFSTFWLWYAFEQVNYTEKMLVKK
jgi:hypothetical protein